MSFKDSRQSPLINFCMLKTSRRRKWSAAIADLEFLIQFNFRCISVATNYFLIATQASTAAAASHVFRCRFSRSLVRFSSFVDSCNNLLVFSIKFCCSADCAVKLSI